MSGSVTYDLYFYDVDSNGTYTLVTNEADQDGNVGSEYASNVTIIDDTYTPNNQDQPYTPDPYVTSVPTNNPNSNTNDPNSYISDSVGGNGGAPFIGTVKDTLGSVVGYLVYTDGVDSNNTDPTLASEPQYGLYVLHGATAPTSFTPGSDSTLDTTDAWVICFLSGTTIATTTGDRKVEALAPGDMVLTADGGAKEVRWVGRSTHARTFADPARAYPVRIKQGALGENLPARDLLVSPGHAVLVRGVLVQAAALVNGVSVVRETPATDMFTYYHVELDSHELLFAEGVPAESFLMGGEHMVFDNIAERPASLGLPGEMPYPRVKAPRQLPASIRALLAERADAVAPGLAIAA